MGREDERKGERATHAALERTAVDVVAVELADGERGVLVRVHLDEGEAAIGLDPRLDHVAEVLEERHEIVLVRVGRQVPDVTGRLPLRRLLDDHVVALDAVGREMVVTVRRGRGHAHGRQLGLLVHRRLPLLVRPVAPDGARPEPLAVHRAEGLFGIPSLAERDEAVATGAAGLHVPHHPSLRDRAEGREGLQQHLVVDLVGQITDEDVKVVRRVLLVLAVGLVSPVHTDLLEERTCQQVNVSTDRPTGRPVDRSVGRSAINRIAAAHVRTDGHVYR